MRPDSRGGIIQVADFSAGITMMIGEAAPARDGKAPPAQVIEEGRRIADTAKCEKVVSPALALGQSFLNRRHSEHRLQPGLRVKDRRVCESAYPGFNCRSMVCPGDDHDIRARQPRTRLSQPPGRQDPAASKRIGGIEQDNIGVALKRQMLKSIIQNEPFCSIFRQREPVLITVFANTKLSPTVE